MRVRTRRAREAASWPYLSACRCWLVDDRTAPVEGLHFHYPVATQKCSVCTRYSPAVLRIDASVDRSVRCPQTRDSWSRSGAGLPGFEDGGIRAAVPGVGSAARRAAHPPRVAHLPTSASRCVRPRARRGDRGLAPARPGSGRTGRRCSPASRRPPCTEPGGSAGTSRRRSSGEAADAPSTASRCAPMRCCRTRCAAWTGCVSPPRRGPPSTWADGCPSIAPSRCSTPSVTPPDCARRRFRRSLAGIGVNVGSRVSATSCRSWIPGAESPPETRTRLVLVRGGLPAPTTQIPIADRSGRIFARAHLGWERWKVLVEYDGEHHWSDVRQRSDERQRTGDIERMERLAELGWVVVRVNAE